MLQGLQPRYIFGTEALLGSLEVMPSRIFFGSNTYALLFRISIINWL